MNTAKAARDAAYTAALAAWDVAYLDAVATATTAAAATADADAAAWAAINAAYHAAIATAKAELATARDARDAAYRADLAASAALAAHDLVDDVDAYAAAYANPQHRAGADTPAEKKEP